VAWDPEQYLKFAVERARPFHDLVARVATPDPKRVVDLGCGPGNVTATLLDRWPTATVHGYDSSTEMIGTARQLESDRLSFSVESIEAWQPEAPIDVIVSNAAFQWVPSHVDLFRGWLGALASGGALAFQVPSNVDNDAAEVFRTTARSPRWAARIGQMADDWGPSASGGVVRSTGDYVDLLGRQGCEVDAWETTYYHLLPGEDPILAWYAGTGLRPFLAQLEDGPESEEFQADVAARLREVYPTHPYGTVLPFRREFVIAYR
jgi:trans-aconitate 2-methyltransferase